MKRSIVCLLAVFVLLPGTAWAEDPPFVGWTAGLPPLPTSPQPEARELCPDGEEWCVHDVIDEMDDRFERLAEDCHHDAPFGLAYLRTTEEYHRFWHEGAFADPVFLNHYDVVFADYYFRARDDWTAGRRDAVPPAWQVAFQAAEDRTLTGRGDLYLGMSAHINRDLPFVLERIGLVGPDGTSRKADHDKVNEFLNRVSDTLLPELAERFDPTIDDSEIEGTTLDNMAGFQVIPAWREIAWRNAERLANAPTPALRAQVAQEIELYSGTLAQLFAAQYAADPGEAEAREAYCHSKL